MKTFGKPNRVAPAYNGPANFCWLIPGLLGGSPRPGVFKDINRDLKALSLVETRLLVTLTEEWTPNAELIGQYNMESLFVPITDLAPPTLEQAETTCRKAAEFTAKGKAVVFHCHAGKGRTGTLLAAMLIWDGQTSQAAITETRNRNQQWIESDSQLEFLEEFQKYCHSLPLRLG